VHNQPYYYKLSETKTQRVGITAEYYMLRHTGDWRGYMAMMNGGGIDVTPFMRGLVNHYANAIESFKGITPCNEGILLGLSVWGGDYLRRFTDFVLPSLLEEENLKALKDKKARILIHTNTHGREILRNHSVINDLVQGGVMVQMMMLDEELLERMGEQHDHKYWHLGLTQSIDLQYAKALNIDYHLMIPDMMYSAGYFKRLFEIKKPIITHSSISASENGFSKALESYRSGNVLNVPAPKLLSLALLNLHPRYDYHFIRENKKIPRLHVMLVEGKDNLHTLSAHQTIAFVSKYKIARLTDRFFFTLDSELEKMFGDEPIYSPQSHDALVTVEISGESYVPPIRTTETIEEFCQYFSANIPQTSLQRLFFQGITLPLDREMLGDRWYMEEEEIAAIRREMMLTIGYKDDVR
jgi:hypothetical protein